MTNLELAALGLPDSLLRIGNQDLIQSVVNTVVHESQMNKLLRSELFNIKKQRDQLVASLKCNQENKQDVVKAKVDEEKAKWKRKLIRLKHVIRQARIKQRADRESFSHLLSVIQQLRNEKNKLLEDSGKNSDFYQRRLQLLGTQMEEMNKINQSKVNVTNEHREELARQVKAKDEALAELKLENERKTLRIKQLEDELRQKQGPGRDQFQLEKVQNELKLVTEKFESEVSRRQQIKQQAKTMEEKLAKMENERNNLLQEIECSKTKFSKELDSQKKIVKQLTEDLLKQRKEKSSNRETFTTPASGGVDLAQLVEEKKELEQQLKKEQNDRKLQFDQLNKEMVRKRTFYEKEIERLRRLKKDNDSLTKEYMALSSLVYTRKSSPSNIENSNEMNCIKDLEQRIAGEMAQRKELEDKYNAMKQHFKVIHEKLQLAVEKRQEQREQIQKQNEGMVKKPSKSSQTSTDNAQTNEKLWLKNLELNDRVKELTSERDKYREQLNAINPSDVLMKRKRVNVNEVSGFSLAPSPSPTTPLTSSTTSSKFIFETS